MRKTTILIFTLSITLCISAQSDFDIAQKFMDKKGVKIVDIPTSTRNHTSGYSIFQGENGKGFVLVCNQSIIGYSTENAHDNSSIPTALEYMLEIYSKTATRGTGSNDYPEEFVVRNTKEIPYMITTKWNQGNPYNKMCPAIDGVNCVAGCGAVAVAQILNYFRLPFETQAIDLNHHDEGFPELEILPPTTFDWANMLDEYIGGQYSEEEANAVAKLMRYCGQSMQTNYGIRDSYSWIYHSLEQNPFVRFFGFDDYFVQQCSSDDNNDESIIDTIDKTLEKGIPFMTNGSNEHFFIIDGRDADGLYHINWGWGGSKDGYYIISPSLFGKYGNKHSIADMQTLLTVCIATATTEFTDIDNMAIEKGSTTSADIYNLQGQKVGNSLENLKRGIYIQNGKKHIIK